MGSLRGIPSGLPSLKATGVSSLGELAAGISSNEREPQRKSSEKQEITFKAYFCLCGLFLSVQPLFIAAFDLDHIFQRAAGDQSPLIAALSIQAFWVPDGDALPASSGAFFRRNPGGSIWRP